MPSEHHFRTLGIAADPNENALIVEYEEADISSSRRAKKLVLEDVHQLNELDVNSVARKVIRKYEFISNDWMDDVCDAIIELCSRSDAMNDSRSVILGHDIDEVIDGALELLYGSLDEKQLGINKVLSLSQDIRVLEYLIQHHQLMSALTRMFSEEDLLTELSFAIGKLFLAFASIEDFHEVLGSYRVGALTLGVLELEVKRACHRGNSPFSNRQERVIMICSRILSLIADDFAALRKMVKRSLATTLGHCLEMKTLDALKSLLTLMMKVCIFEEAAEEISSGEKVIAKLVDLLHVPDISNRVASVLFNLSFHNNCASIISSTNIHAPMTRHLLTQQSIHRLAYHLSYSEVNRQKFVSAGISSKLVEFLKNLNPREPIDEGLAGLLVNMTLHPLCAEEMAQSGVVSDILKTIENSDDEYTAQVLLKVMRNLTLWSRQLQLKLRLAMTWNDARPLDGLVKRSESYFTVAPATGDDQCEMHTPSSMYWEHHFWDGVVETILENALDETVDDNLLVEWIGALSNLTKDDMPAGLHWHDLIYDNSSKLLSLFYRILDSTHDDLKMQVVIWLGELCTSQECSAWIASSNLIEALHDELMSEGGCDEMKLQILLSYQQFMMYEETRFQVVCGNGIVEAIVDCLSGRHALTIAAEECLILMEDFDRDEYGNLGNLGTLLQCARYEALIEHVH